MSINKKKKNSLHSRGTHVRRGDAIDISLDGSVDSEIRRSRELVRKRGISEGHPPIMDVATGTEADVGTNRLGSGNDRERGYGAGTEYGIDTGTADSSFSTSTDIDVGPDEGADIDPRTGSKFDKTV